MAKKKLTKEERDKEFTTLDANEEIIESGRRASYRVNDKAEVAIKKKTDKELAATSDLIKKNKYKATKATKEGMKKINRSLNKATTPAADDLDAGIRITVEDTSISHANKFKYGYEVERIDRSIKKAAVGGKMSSKLHKGNNKAMKAFTSTLFKGIKEGEGAISLARTLSKIPDIVASDITVPRYIMDIENALRRAARVNDRIERVAQVKEIKVILRKHRKYIDDLTRAGADGFQQLGIGGASRRFAKQAEAFTKDISKLNETNVDKIVHRWRTSKVRYYQTRVTRTETNNVYSEYSREYWQELQADGIVAGVDVVLSDSHPEYDICDELQGRYENIDTAPLAPHHPNCICRNIVVLPDEIRYNGDIGPNKPFVRGLTGEGNGRQAA